MIQKLKRRSVAFVAVVVLLLVNLAGPASAGYREGRISCQSGWTVFTESNSGGSTWHEHYLEPWDTTLHYTGYFRSIWYTQRNYGTWSVQATPLLSGGAGCTQL